MKSFIVAGAAFAASISGVYALSAADLCAMTGGGKNEGGNWFCEEVEKVTYTGINKPGKYQRVVSMDPTTGHCQKEEYSYSGPSAPLDKEITYHIRGPANIKQVAAYAPGPQSKKMSRRSAHERRHSHSHVHGRKVGDTVKALINGKWTEWTNAYDGGAGGAPAAPAPAHAANNHASDYIPTEPEEVELDDGDWKRIAYYNQKKKNHSYGFSWLNHKGSDGTSGTFDYKFGNSLSFASADGKSAASKNTPFNGKLDSSSCEIVLATDKPCEGDSCGYVRPKSVAMHGFDGPSKALFFEIAMPDDGKKGASKYAAVNMPAVWALNADIPRTSQYGECSCWTSGCGEFDIIEVLASGDNKCKSTLHKGIGLGGGDSNYFARPIRPTKFVFILHNGKIVVEKLDDNFDFSPKMSAAAMKKILTCNESNPHASIFSLAG